MKKGDNLKDIMDIQEVKELYKLALAFDLREEAIKLIQNAINKKRSEAIRKSERSPNLMPNGQKV